MIQGFKSQPEPEQKADSSEPPEISIRGYDTLAEDLSDQIKDFRDELNILKSVANYQEIVQQRLERNTTGGGDIARDDLTATYILNDIKQMDNTAQRIEAAVSAISKICLSSTESPTN